jgi:hypothetical protein
MTVGARRRAALSAALLLMAGLCGCGDHASRNPSGTASPVPRPPPDAASSCFKSLDQRHVGYDRLADFHTEEGCGIDQAIKLKSTPIPLDRPLLLTCPTALSLADFETQVVAPSAMSAFGRKVTSITSAGSYDCRGQRSDHPERLSEHALGRAIDITGFTLEDGRRITVAKNWWGKDSSGDFLRQVAAGACRLFSVVLTPRSNRLHHDHLHLDNGPHKKCDA